MHWPRALSSFTSSKLPANGFYVNASGHLSNSRNVATFFNLIKHCKRLPAFMTILISWKWLGLTPLGQMVCGSSSIFTMISIRVPYPKIMFDHNHCQNIHSLSKIIFSFLVKNMCQKKHKRGNVQMPKQTCIFIGLPSSWPQNKFFYDFRKGLHWKTFDNGGQGRLYNH